MDKPSWTHSMHGRIEYNISFLKFYSLYHRADGIDDGRPATRALRDGGVRGKEHPRTGHRLSYSVLWVSQYLC